MRRILCLSHASGAGGESIGRQLAALLGFRYVDEEIVVRAAAALDVSPAVVAEVERQAPATRNRPHSALDGVLELLRRATATPPPEALPPEQLESYRALIRHAVRATAEEGSVVIVSHAASMAIGPRDDALRVLVTASRERRVEAVADALGSTLARAEATIDGSDLAREEYLRRFYGVEQELPTHYDLVISTDTLTPAEAVAAVVAAARGGEPDSGDRDWR